MKGGANGGVRGKKTCFNCGGDDHAARECKAPNSNFKYAVCFTCGETGHLVRDCPSNKQGIYINGGACKICKGTDHLAMHCPSKDKCLRCGEKGHVSSACPKENSGKYVPPKRVRAGRGAAPGGTVPPRGGGDDLEDDFEEELGEAAEAHAWHVYRGRGRAAADDEIGSVLPQGIQGSAGGRRIRHGGAVPVRAGG